jgi:hypothetical protein
MAVSKTRPTEPHGWVNTETLSTAFGDFEFEGGYPVGDTTQRLFDLQKVYRAVEVYLTQLMPVSEIAVREGMRVFGQKTPQQVVIWEDLMDPGTVLLTANTETVYAMTHLDLKKDGPTVVEAPPKMLGFLQNGIQRYVMDIGPLGPDKGKGGKFLVLPPDYQGEEPKDYFVARSPTYSVTFAVRGFQEDGKTAPAVALMKQIKVYPLATADAPPAMQFLNGSHQKIDTLFPDNDRFFDLLAMLVDEEPRDIFGPLERAQMQMIGIEKGKPFKPDAKTRKLLAEGARIGGAMARATTFASQADEVFYYPDRKWQGILPGNDYTFARDGIPQIDARNNVYYMAAGNSPAMMAKNVGQGSQYLWTYRDAEGEWLQGANAYRLRVPANVPIKNFWSVVVYDALSRSELQTSQKLPSVSQYTDPKKNDDGTIDIFFGPKCPPGQERNWIETLPDRGWFPIFRFYSPTEAYFDKSWKLPDIERVK